MNRESSKGERGLRKDPETPWKRLIESNIDSMVLVDANSCQGRIVGKRFNWNTQKESKKTLSSGEDERTIESKRQQTGTPDHSEGLRYKDFIENSKQSNVPVERTLGDNRLNLPNPLVDLNATVPFSAVQTDVNEFGMELLNVEYGNNYEPRNSVINYVHQTNNAEMMVSGKSDDRYRSIEIAVGEAIMENKSTFEKSSTPSEENKGIYHNKDVSLIMAETKASASFSDLNEGEDDLTYVQNNDNGNKYSFGFNSDVHSAEAMISQPMIQLSNDPHSDTVLGWGDNDTKTHSVICSYLRGEREEYQRHVSSVESSISNPGDFKTSLDVDGHGKKKTQFSAIREFIPELTEIIQTRSDESQSDNLSDETIRKTDCTNVTTPADDLVKDIEESSIEYNFEQRLSGTKPIQCHFAKDVSIMHPRKHKVYTEQRNVFIPDELESETNEHLESLVNSTVSELTSNHNTQIGAYQETLEETPPYTCIDECADSENFKNAPQKTHDWRSSEIITCALDKDARNPHRYLPLNSNGVDALSDLRSPDKRSRHLENTWSEGVTESRRDFGGTIKSVEKDLPDSNLFRDTCTTNRILTHPTESSSLFADQWQLRGAYSFPSGFTSSCKIEDGISLLSTNPREQLTLDTDTLTNFSQADMSCNGSKKDPISTPLVINTDTDEGIETIENDSRQQDTLVAFPYLRNSNICHVSRDILADDVKDMSLKNGPSTEVFSECEEWEDVNGIPEEQACSNQGTELVVNCNHDEDRIEMSLDRIPNTNMFGVKDDVTTVKNLVQSPTTPWRRLMEVNINSMFEGGNSTETAGTIIVTDNSFQSKNKNQTVEKLDSGNEQDNLIRNKLPFRDSVSYYQNMHKIFESEDVSIFNKNDFDNGHLGQVQKTVDYLHLTNSREGETPGSDCNRSVVWQSEDLRGMHSPCSIGGSNMSGNIMPTCLEETSLDIEPVNRYHLSSTQLQQLCSDLSSTNTCKRETNQLNQILCAVSEEDANYKSKDFEGQEYEMSDSGSSEADSISNDTETFILNDDDIQKEKLDMTETISSRIIHSPNLNTYSPLPCGQTDIEWSVYDPYRTYAKSEEMTVNEMYESDDSDESSLDSDLCSYLDASEEILDSESSSCGVCNETEETINGHIFYTNKGYITINNMEQPQRTELLNFPCTLIEKNCTTPKNEKDLEEHENQVSKNEDISWLQVQDKPSHSHVRVLGENEELREQHANFLDEKSEENIYLNVLIHEGKIIDRRHSTAALQRDKNLVHSPTTPWKRLMETNVNSLLGPKHTEKLNYPRVIDSNKLYATSNETGKFPPNISNVTADHSVREKIPLDDSVGCVENGDRLQLLTDCFREESESFYPSQIDEIKADQLFCQKFEQVEENKTLYNDQNIATLVAHKEKDCNTRLSLTPTTSGYIDPKVILNSDQTLTRKNSRCWKYQESPSFEQNMHETNIGEEDGVVEFRVPSATDRENVDRVIANEENRRDFPGKHNSEQNLMPFAVTPYLTVMDVGDANALEFSDINLSHGQTSETIDLISYTAINGNHGQDDDNAFDKEENSHAINAAVSLMVESNEEKEYISSAQIFEISTSDIRKEMKITEPDNTSQMISDFSTEEFTEYIKYESPLGKVTYEQEAFEPEINEHYQFNPEVHAGLNLVGAGEIRNCDMLSSTSTVPQALFAASLPETVRGEEDDSSENLDKNLALYQAYNFTLNIPQMNSIKSSFTPKPLSHLNRDPLTQWKRLVDSNIDSIFLKEVFLHDIIKVTARPFITNSTNNTVTAKQDGKWNDLERSCFDNFDPLSLLEAKSSVMAENIDKRNYPLNESDLHDRRQDSIYFTSIKPELIDNVKEEVNVDAKEDEVNENVCGENFSNEHFLDHSNIVHHTSISSPKSSASNTKPDFLECCQDLVDSDDSVSENHHSQIVVQEENLFGVTSLTIETAPLFTESPMISVNECKNLAVTQNISDDESQEKGSSEDVDSLCESCSWESAINKEERFLYSEPYLPNTNNVENSCLESADQDFQSTLKSTQSDEDIKDQSGDNMSLTSQCNYFTAKSQLLQPFQCQTDGSLLKVSQQKHYSSHIDEGFKTMNEIRPSLMNVFSERQDLMLTSQVINENIIGLNLKCLEKNAVCEPSSFVENQGDDELCNNYISEKFKLIVSNGKINQPVAKANTQTLVRATVKRLNNNPSTQWKRLMETNINSMIKTNPNFFTNQSLAVTRDTKQSEGREGLSIDSSNHKYLHSHALITGPTVKTDLQSIHPLLDEQQNAHEGNEVDNNAVYEFNREDSKQLNISSEGNSEVNVKKSNEAIKINRNREGTSQEDAFEYIETKHEMNDDMDTGRITPFVSNAQLVESYFTDIEIGETASKMKYCEDLADKYSYFSTLVENSKLNLFSKETPYHTCQEDVSNGVQIVANYTNRDKPSTERSIDIVGLDSSLSDNKSYGIQKAIGVDKTYPHAPAQVVSCNFLPRKSSGDESTQISSLFMKNVGDDSIERCLTQIDEQREVDAWSSFVSKNNEMSKENHAIKAELVDYVSNSFPNLDNCTSKNESFIYKSQPTPLGSSKLPNDNKDALVLKRPSSSSHDEENLHTKYKINGHFRFVHTHDIKSIQCSDVRLKDNSDSLFYMSPKLQNPLHASPIKEGTRKINTVKSFDEPMNENFIDQIKNNSRVPFRENEEKVQTEDDKSTTYSIESEIWCKEVKLCSLLDIVESFPLVSSVTVLPPTSDVVLDNFGTSTMKEDSCSTELLTLKSCDDDSKISPVDGRMYRGLFAISNFIKNLFSVSDQPSSTGDTEECHKYTSARFKGPPDLKCLRDRDGRDKYIVENENSPKEHTASSKSTKKRHRRKNPRIRQQLLLSSQPRRKSRYSDEFIQEPLKESEKFNNNVPTIRKETYCKIEAPALVWRSDDGGSTKRGVQSDRFESSKYKKFQREYLNRSTRFSAWPKPRHRNELVLNTKSIPNDKNLSEFFSSPNNEEMTPVSTASNISTYYPGVVKIKDIVQSRGALKIDNQNDIQLTKESPAKGHFQALKSARYSDSVNESTDGESDEDTESIGTDIEPSDMLKYSLECLLEVVVQRGKIVQTFVADFDGGILAKTARCDIRREDVLAIDRSLTSSYQGMSRLSVFSEVFTCIQCQRESPSITGTSGRSVLVALRGGSTLVVGLGLNSTPGSCIKEIEELAEVLKQRGL